MRRLMDEFSASLLHFLSSNLEVLVLNTPSPQTKSLHCGKRQRDNDAGTPEVRQNLGGGGCAMLGKRPLMSHLTQSSGTNTKAS